LGGTLYLAELLLNRLEMLTEEQRSIPIPSMADLRGKKILYDKTYQQGYDFVIGLNDVRDFVKGIPRESVNLVVTSPPYNVGKAYEETIGLKDYLSCQKEIIKDCIATLSANGSICWEVGNYIEDNEVFPLDIFFYKIFKEFGLKLRNRIIWRVGHGLHSTRSFSGRYETILWFTKGDDYIFNLDEVRIPQKYPGKRSYKGPNKGKPTSNPLGKNPSNFWDPFTSQWDDEIWERLVEDWQSLVWEIPNVKSAHPEKTVHPSQFPIELVERLVLALTSEKEKENVVFDPFQGVGSSIVAAALHNRKAIGVDKVKEYSDIAYERTISALKGTIKKRPLGKPIMLPSQGGKVAKIPEEWLGKN
jgi:adenine-specific DNA-methyltransferase